MTNSIAGGRLTYGNSNILGKCYNKQKERDRTLYAVYDLPASTIGNTYNYLLIDTFGKAKWVWL